MMDYTNRLQRLSAQSLARGTSAVWLVIILLASVFGRRIQRSFDWASPILPYAALALLLIMLLVFSLFYRRRFSTGKFPPAFTLYIIVISITVIGLGYSILSLLVAFPIEAAHLIKFAPFAFFVFWGAKATNLRKRFLWSLVLGIAIGLAEETLQLWIPDRVFDWKDLAFNALSASLGSAYAAALFWGLRYFGPESQDPS